MKGMGLGRKVLATDDTDGADVEGPRGGKRE